MSDLVKLCLHSWLDEIVRLLCVYFLYLRLIKILTSCMGVLALMVKITYMILVDSLILKYA